MNEQGAAPPRRLWRLVALSSLLVLMAILLVKGATAHAQADEWSSLRWEADPSIYEFEGMWISDMDWDPSHRHVSVTSYSRYLSILDVPSWPSSTSCSLVNPFITSTAWSPDGSLLAVANEQQNITILWANNWTLYRRLGFPDRYGTISVDWSPDGRYLALNRGPSIVIWDVTSWEMKTSFYQGIGNVTSLRWSPDSELLAIGTGNGLVYSLRENRTINVATNQWTWYVSWSPDGSLLATVEQKRNSNSVHIWRRSDWQQVKQFTDEVEEFRGCEWSPDGRLLAVFGNDCHARIYNATDWSLVWDTVLPDQVVKLRWGPNLTVFTTGEWGMKVRLWNIPLASVGEDLSASIATTGDPYTWRVAINACLPIRPVVVHYRLPGSPSWHSIGMTEGPDGNWTATVPVPDALGELEYYIEVTDVFNRSKATEPRAVQVRDDDPPVLGQDLSDRPAWEGHAFSFRVECQDNIGLRSVSVEWGLGGAPLVVALSGDGVYQATIMLPHRLATLAYEFVAEDTSGNLARAGTFTVDVVDVDPPRVADRTVGVATTGDAFRFSADLWDDIGLGAAWVEYTVSNVSCRAEMDIVGGTRGFAEVTVPHARGDLAYEIWAEDTSGNRNSTGPFAVAIVDDDAPTLVRDLTADDAITGGTILLVAEVADNIAVASVDAEWSLDGSPACRSPLALEAGSWGGIIDIPLDCNGLAYRLRATDEAGNEAVWEWRSLTVCDAVPPAATGPGDIQVLTGEPFTLSLEASDNRDPLALELSFEGTQGWFVLTKEGDKDVSWSISDSDLGVTTQAFAGAFKWCLRATDASGNGFDLGTRGSPFTVRVVDARPPVPAFECPKSALTGETVALLATNSTDNVGIGGYRWRIVGPEGQVHDGEGVGILLALEEEGTYTITLNVTDTSGNSAELTRMISVKEKPSYLVRVGGWLLAALLVAATIGLVSYWMLRRRGRP